MVIIKIITYNASYVQTRGINWQVSTGRRDGRVSLASDASNLPGFRESIDSQKQKFAAFGLSTQDLVTLVGKQFCIYAQKFLSN